MGRCRLFQVGMHRFFRIPVGIFSSRFGICRPFSKYRDIGSVFSIFPFASKRHADHKNLLPSQSADFDWQKLSAVRSSANFTAAEGGSEFSSLDASNPGE